MAWRDYIFDNLGWKGTSLALAMLIWAAIDANVEDAARTQRNAVVSTLPLRLPILVTIAPTEGREFKVNPSTVDVVLGGNAEVLERLKESDVEVLINLKDVPDVRSLRRRVEVHPPPGITVEKIEPAQVTVEVLRPGELQNSHQKD